MSAMEKGKALAKHLNSQLDTMGVINGKRTEKMADLMTGAIFGARAAGDNELAEHIEMRLSLFQEAIPAKQKRSRKLVNDQPQAKAA